MPKDREMSLDELIDKLTAAKCAFGGETIVRVQSDATQGNPEITHRLTPEKRRVVEIR